MFPIEPGSDHSIFFYLLTGVLIIDLLQGLGIGSLFFLKRSGDFRANTAYGLLLIVFGLTLLHYLLEFLGIYQRFAGLIALPIYFSLSFPVLLFFHVKLQLYPNYRLRWTDVKHLLLPLGQFLYFAVFFLFTSTAYREAHFARNPYNPFYGAFEQFLYLVTFFAYLYFSYRYVKRKKREVHYRGEARKVRYADQLVRVFFVLFCIHTAFLISDFVMYQLMGINLRASKPYAALGIWSFAALLFWLGVYGVQVLIWGRKIFKR